MVLAILFDAVMLAVVLITVILCIKRGFVESLFRSLGFITAVFCALILTSVISPFLKDAFVEDLSFKFVSTTVCKTGDGRGFDDIFKDIVDENPEFCKAVEHIGINVSELEEYASEISESEKEEATALLIKKIATPLCDLLSDVLAFLIGFAGAYLLIKLAAYLLDVIVKLPLLRGLNKTFGALYGIVLGWVRAGFVIMITTAAYPIIASYYPEIPFLEDIVARTVIFEFLANNNLLSLIINTFI